MSDGPDCHIRNHTRRDHGVGSTDHLTGSDRLHYLSYYPVLFTKQQMNVIGHQTVGIDVTSTGFRSKVVPHPLLHC